MTDRGTYIKMSDGLPEHRKIGAVGGDAGWLHVCALAYCSRNLTDGFIPQSHALRISDRKQPAKLMQKLVEVRLWHGPGHDCPRCAQPPAGEYVIHDYLLHQRSAARVAEVSEKRATSGRKGGTVSKPKPKQVASGLLGEGLPDAQANTEPSFAEGVLRTPQTEEPLRGSQAEADVPPTAGAETAPPSQGAIAAAFVDGAKAVDTASAPTAQTILANFIDWVRSSGGDLTRRTTGQLAKQLGDLLEQGISDRHIRRGLADWHAAGQNPSTLDSFVNAAVNANSRGQAQRPGANGHVLDRRQEATNQLFDRAMDRARALDAQEAQQ